MKTIRMKLLDKSYRKMEGHESWNVYYHECSSYDDQITRVGCTLSLSVNEKEFNALDIGHIIKFDLP